MRPSRTVSLGAYRWQRVLVWLLALGAVAAFAAQFDGDKIQLLLSPDPATVGGSVHLTGWVLPHLTDRTVLVRFDPPSGSANKRVLEFKCRDDGTFDWSWGILDEPGEWRLRLKGPAAEDIADVTFDVQPATMVPASIGVSMDAAMSAANAAFAEYETELGSYPEVPGKQEALARSQTAHDKMGVLATGVGEINAACGELTSVLRDCTAPLPSTTAALVSVQEKVQQQQAALQEHAAAMQSGVAEAKSATMWCKTWYTLGQVMKEFVGLTKTLLALSGGVATWAAGQLKDAVENDVKNAISSAAYAQYTDAQKAQLMQVQADVNKAVTRIHQAHDPMGSASDILTEAINWCIDWLVKDVTKHCRIYAGPVKGDLRIDYYAKGKPYIRVRYKIDAKGEMFFRPREGSGKPVQLEGKIRGDAQSFIGTATVDHLVGPIPGAFGLGIHIPRFTKKPFFLSVEGQAQADKMELRIKEALTDFDPAPYRFLFVLFAPYQMVPTVDLTTMNVPGAHWAFTRGTSTAGAEKQFELPITAEGNVSKARRKFEREMDYKDRLEFMGYINLDFDLSSPPPDSY